MFLFAKTHFLNLKYHWVIRTTKTSPTSSPEMSSRVFSSSSTPPSSGSRSSPLPWTAPPPCKENTLWYLQLNFLFTNVYHSFAPDKSTTLEYERLCAFLMIATIGLCCFPKLYIHLCSTYVSWIQSWLDSSFPCRRSIYHITCALLNIQLHSSSRLVNFPPRPCGEPIIVTDITKHCWLRYY